MACSGEKRAEWLWGGAVNGCYGKCIKDKAAQVDGFIFLNIKFGCVI